MKCRSAHRYVWKIQEASVGISTLYNLESQVPRQSKIDLFLLIASLIAPSCGWCLMHLFGTLP
jgi:hypothetical protein